MDKQRVEVIRHLLCCITTSKIINHLYCQLVITLVISVDDLVLFGYSFDCYFTMTCIDIQNQSRHQRFSGWISSICLLKRWNELGIIVNQKKRNERANKAVQNIALPCTKLEYPKLLICVYFQSAVCQNVKKVQINDLLSAFISAAAAWPDDIMVSGYDWWQTHVNVILLSCLFKLPLHLFVWSTC